MGVLVPVLLTLDTFSSSAAFLVHLFFSLPALPPKQFTYFPDITGASLCIWTPGLHLMDEIVQQRGQKLVPHQPTTSNINVFTQQMCCAHHHHFKKRAQRQQGCFQIIPLSPHTVDLGSPYQNSAAVSRSTGRPAGTFGLCCQ